jgi:hypothetical protein
MSGAARTFMVAIALAVSAATECAAGGRFAADDDLLKARKMPFRTMRRERRS